MRILHTSDWHLGKSLENRERLPEQWEVLDEICRIADERQVDLVAITGDIFDTYVPSAAAEELFYDAVERLAAGGRRAVVIIAGNHDSPDRLCAARPLADRNGIILLGLPGSQAQLSSKAGGVEVLQAGPGWLELTVPGCAEPAVIIALPYPSEARLDQALSGSLDQEVLQKAYSEKVGRIFADLAGHFRADTVNLALSHLFILGGESSDSERPIQLGGALTVTADQLPVQAGYVALGHLHKPQKAPGAKMPAYYAGSPLAYSFGETGYAKAVMLVEIYPGQDPKVDKIELTRGKPLVKWLAKGGVAEVLNWCRAGKDAGAWIELEIHLDRPLTPEEIRIIRSMREEIINIRPVIADPQEQEILAENRLARPLPELFSGFYQSKIGAKPRPELVDYFLELAGRDQDEPEEGGMASETA
jgi:exonuclease SbcD